MVILDGNAFGCEKTVLARKAVFCPTSIMLVLFLLTGLTSVNPVV